MSLDAATRPRALGRSGPIRPRRRGGGGPVLRPAPPRSPSPSQHPAGAGLTRGRTMLTGDHSLAKAAKLWFPAHTRPPVWMLVGPPGLEPGTKGL